MADEIIFKEYKEDIETLFTPKRKYTFLVGAGISMDPPSNMPSARQIVKGLLDLCAPEEEIDNLLSLDMLRFELVVEKIQEAYDEDLKFLDFYSKNQRVSGFDGKYSFNPSIITCYIPIQQ